MTNTEDQRKIFWELFERVLFEKGEPFKIGYKKKDNEITFYAAVNKYYANTPSKSAIDLSFIFRDGKFRINFYIPNTRFGAWKLFTENKEQITSKITKASLLWENGSKNKNTLRPSVYFNFIQNDVDDYRRVIEESISTILEFIEIANIYGKYEFFDF